MKKILIIILLFITSNVYAAAPTRTYNYVASTTIDPTQVNTNENSLYTYLQNGVDTFAALSITNAAVSNSAAIAYTKLNLTGSIVNSDINGSAGIVDSKLATISTAGKVNTSALTGTVATTNLGTGIASSTTVLFGDQTYKSLPAQVGLGSWDSSKSLNTPYQAATDGTFMGTCTTSGSTTITALTDSANPPTTARLTQSGSVGSISVSCPVKKNDYWKVTCTQAGTVYFIPLGS